MIYLWNVLSKNIFVEPPLSTCSTQNIFFWGNDRTLKHSFSIFFVPPLSICSCYNIFWKWYHFRILCGIFSSHRHSQLVPITMFSHTDFLLKLCCGNMNLNFQHPTHREINRPCPLVRQKSPSVLFCGFTFDFGGLRKGLNKH